MGGAVFNHGGSLQLTNCALWGSQAQGGSGFNGGSGLGGAVYNVDGDVSLTNVTIAGSTIAAGSGGSPTAAGGALYNHQASGVASITLLNTILADSSGGNDLTNNGGNVSGSDNLAESHSGIPGGVVSLSTDPHLVNPATGDLRLQSNSPAIDAGNGAVCPAVDLRGQSRTNDWQCDIGAFEAQLSDTTTVSKPVSGEGTYTFGPTLAKIEVTPTDGCLTGLQVQRVASNHPHATTNLQTGVYWIITPTPAVGCSFVTTLTLPFAAADSTTRACRWLEGSGGGAGWDCGDDNANTPGGAWVARSNVTAFSDWAVGSNLGLTSIALDSFTANNAQAALPIGWMALSGLLAILAVVAWRRR